MNTISTGRRLISDAANAWAVSRCQGTALLASWSGAAGSADAAVGRAVAGCCPSAAAPVACAAIRRQPSRCQQKTAAIRRVDFFIPANMSFTLANRADHQRPDSSGAPKLYRSKRSQESHRNCRKIRLQVVWCPHPAQSSLSAGRVRRPTPGTGFSSPPQAGCLTFPRNPWILSRVLWRNDFDVRSWVELRLPQKVFRGRRGIGLVHGMSFK